VDPGTGALAVPIEAGRSGAAVAEPIAKRCFDADG
jgi:hypothetical protein